MSILMGMFILLLSSKAMAQQHGVSGVVTDAVTGESLPGVNILVQGTSQGTTTNFDGEYQINTEPDAVLVFSYVGYETTEVPIEGRELINLPLNQASVIGSELVVVGYGAQQERQLT
ncbi:MAG: carboxypeptidase-like regulatory domain-containing protein, partial [Candidatus Paceibacterota bacterium]